MLLAAIFKNYVGQMTISPLGSERKADSQGKQALGRTGSREEETEK